MFDAIVTGLALIAACVLTTSCADEGSSKDAQPDVTASAKFGCNQLRTKLPTQPSGEQLSDCHNSLSSDTLAKMEELCPGLSKDFDKQLNDWLVASADDSEVTAPPAAPDDGSYQDSVSSGNVTYTVKGSAEEVSVTMRSPTGTEQRDASLYASGGSHDWPYQFDSGEFVYVSAQNQSEFGDVTCQIFVDGELVSENTSNAAFGIAQCDGQTS